jgi:enoyl-CoA hydratase/carnithine racemase
MGKEGALFIEQLASPEVAEAITAFFEKRKPNFG